MNTSRSTKPSCSETKNKLPSREAKAALFYTLSLQSTVHIWELNLSDMLGYLFLPPQHVALVAIARQITNVLQNVLCGYSSIHHKG